MIHAARLTPARATEDAFKTFDEWMLSTFVTAFFDVHEDKCYAKSTQTTDNASKQSTFNPKAYLPLSHAVFNQIILPMSEGGLGLRLTSDLAFAAFFASAVAASKTHAQQKTSTNIKAASQTS
jgi:hypothetical protein